MQINKVVEWAAHTCALFAVVPANGVLALETLAQFIGVTPPYLAKQMQMLSRANIVSTKRGVAGAVLDTCHCCDSWLSNAKRTRRSSKSPTTGPFHQRLGTCWCGIVDNTSRGGD